MAIDELLSSNLIGRHLDRAGLERVLSMAAPRRYAAGERIAHYGEVWPYLFLLESGSITALKESAHRWTLS